MKRGFTLSVLVVMLFVVTAVTASAGFTWCLSDPHVKLPGDGGVVHLTVAVPSEHQDTGFTLDVWAPVGSRQVGGTGAVNVTVVLHKGADGQVVATTAAGFPVQLSARLKGQDLGAYYFEEGSGTALWVW
jgi:hypothetical protein